MYEPQTSAAGAVSNADASSSPLPSPGQIFAYVTTFDGNETDRVLYLAQDGDGDIHELYLQSGQPWQYDDLTAAAQASLAIIGCLPFAYTTDVNNSQAARVLYLGYDKHIYELSLQSGQSWVYTDLTAAAQAPAAQTGPVAYVTGSNENQVARVVYVGTNNHVYELYLQSGQGWQFDDLTAAAQAPSVNAVWPISVFGYATGTGDNQVARVIFCGTNAHVYELYLQSGQGWQYNDLTAATNAPTNFFFPFAYVTGSGSDPVARVLYIDRNNHICELSLQSGQPWVYTDLTAAAQAPAVSGGSVFGYVTNFNNEQIARVVYIAGTNQVHELYLQSGQGWQFDDLTAAAQAPSAYNAVPVGVFAYVTGPSGNQTARVVYVGLSNIHLYELYLQSGQPWQYDDLTAATN